MGIYVFSRDVLMDVLAGGGAKDFGREVIPSAIGRYHINAHVFRGYWADVGTVASFYDANIMLTQPGAPFKLYDPRRPIYTHARYLPGARLIDCIAHDAIVCEGCFVERSRIEESIVGIRTNVQSGSTIRRSVLLGADFYETETTGPVDRQRPRLGIGRDVVLDRVIVDKNARIGDGAHLCNSAGVQHADGDGYFIRDGIIVVPKDGVIKHGTRA
jgi:glucose-1-phosphate adenylyltransferase